VQAQLTPASVIIVTPEARVHAAGRKGSSCQEEGVVCPARMESNRSKVPAPLTPGTLCNMWYWSHPASYLHIAGDAGDLMATSA
jgi:hypothetical protein